MNENLKTVSFVGAAVLVLLIAWVARPSLPVASPVEMEGKLLFPDFKDPLAATSLEIIQFDEATGKARPFKVAQVKEQGKDKVRWLIPSHENYPADAKEQLAAAASSLMDLKVVSVASDNAGEHADFGVIDPGSNPKPGTTGVGTRVVIRDKDDKELLALVIGKEVPDRSNLRYVRRVAKEGAEDQVYIVPVSTDKLSTKFEDWIEKDLLRISSWDLKNLNIQDYTVANLGIGRLAMDPRSRVTLVYNDNDPKWTLQRGEVFNKDREKDPWQPLKLADDEELNASKLDDMKSALGDLKIVDVARKPHGLSKNLKASGQLVANTEALRSLTQRGFYLVPVGQGSEVDLLSNKGEMRVLMKDGVEYVLRFGEIAGAGAEQKDAKKDEKKGDKQGDKKKDDAGGESTTPGVNRYLFVMAEFTPDSIAKPELEPLPKDEPPADAKKPDAKKEDTKKDDTKDPGKKEGGAKEGGKKDEKKPDLKAERERIEKENKRKQDEYKEKIKKAEDRVNELNGRFAEWYYVIEDVTYKKIHLTREDIVKKKEKKEEGKKDESKDAHDHKLDEAASPAAKQPAPAAKEPKKDVPAAKSKQPGAAAEKSKPSVPAAKQATPGAAKGTPAVEPKRETFKSAEPQPGEKRKPEPVEPTRGQFKPAAQEPAAKK